MTRYQVAFALWIGLPVLMSWVWRGAPAYEYPLAGMIVHMTGTALLVRFATRGLDPDRARADQPTWAACAFSAVALFYGAPMAGLIPPPLGMKGTFSAYLMSGLMCALLAVLFAAPAPPSGPERRSRARMLAGEVAALAAHWSLTVLWFAWVIVWLGRRPFHDAADCTPAHLQAMLAVALALVAALLAGEVAGWAARRRLRESEAGLLDLRESAEAMLRTVARDAAAKLAPDAPSALRVREFGGAVFLAGAIDLLLILAAAMIVFDASMARAMIGGAATGELLASFALALAALLASRRVCLVPVEWALVLFGLVYGLESYGPDVFRPGAGMAVGVVAAGLALVELRRRGLGTVIVEGGGRAVAYRLMPGGRADAMEIADAQVGHEPFHLIDLTRPGAAGVQRGATDPSRPLVAFVCAALAFGVAAVRVTERYGYSSDNAMRAIAAWGAGDRATLERVCATTLAGAPDEPIALALMASARAAQRRYDEAGVLLERAWRGGATGGMAGTYIGLGRAYLFIRRHQMAQARERWRKGEREGAASEEQFVARHVVREMKAVPGGVTGMLAVELATWERAAGSP